MTALERRRTPLAIDPTLFLDSLNDEQRAIFIHSATMPAHIFVMPFMRVLSNWWLSIGDIERAVLTDRAIKAFYVEAPLTPEQRAQFTAQMVEEIDGKTGAGEIADAAPETA